MVDGLDMAMYLGCLLAELFTCDKGFPQDCYIDNHSLFENIQSEISSVKWIPAGYQIADSFTKRGASCKRLAQVLRSGHLCDIFQMKTGFGLQCFFIVPCSIVIRITYQVFYFNPVK